MSATNDLLRDYQHVIESLTLITGGAGVFDVRVNDKLIYSKSQTGRHAEVGEVHKLFAEHVGPDIAVFER